MSGKFRDLRQVLRQSILDLSSNNDKIDGIKEYMKQFEVHFGEVGKVFNNVDLLDTTDIRFIALLTEAIFETAKINELNPKLYFTDVELKEAHHYSGNYTFDEEEVKLPLHIDNAIKVSDSSYMVTLTAKQINGLRKKVLYYNTETQRETTKVKSKDSFFEVPTLNKDSVKDICKCLLTGTLYPSTLTLNAAVRTSDSGNEILFNEKTKELIITEGTRLDILDGYHRIMGIMMAFISNKDIDMTFPVLITNYSIPNAKKYLAQLSKANPISKARIEELSAEKLSSTVIGELRTLSILKGKISQTERINKTVGELVSYSILAETIDSEFKMKNKADAMDVAEYLVEFFDYLIGRYEDEFITEYDIYRKKSLINHNIMFIGYVTLAARMFENNESVRNIRKYMQEINFDRDNEEWHSMKLIVNNAISYRPTTKNKIKKYFNEIYQNNN